MRADMCERFRVLNRSLLLATGHRLHTGQAGLRVSGPQAVVTTRTQGSIEVIHQIPESRVQFRDSLELLCVQPVSSSSCRPSSF